MVEKQRKFAEYWTKSMCESRRKNNSTDELRPQSRFFRNNFSIRWFNRMPPLRETRE